MAVLLCIIACGGGRAAEQRPQRADSRPAAPPSTDIVVPEVKIPPRLPHGTYVMMTPRVDDEALASASQKPLATDRALSERLRRIAADRKAATQEVSKARLDRAKLQREGRDADEAKRQTVLKGIQAFDTRIGRVHARVNTATKQLFDLLGKNAKQLTFAGAKLHVLVTRDQIDLDFDAALEAQEKSGAMPNPNSPMSPDYKSARDLAVDMMTRFPEAERDAGASYLHLVLLLGVSDEPAKERALAQRMLDVAHRFAGTVVEEAAYVVSAQKMMWDRDPAAAKIADEGFAWLADRASDPYTRSTAQLRLAERHVTAGNLDAARTRFCQAIDANVSTDGEFGLASTFDERSIAPLRDACSAKRCPCTAQTLATLASLRNTVEDYAQEHELQELIVANFPMAASAAGASCNLIRVAEEAGSAQRVAELREAHGTKFGKGTAWARANPGYEGECRSWEHAPPSKATPAERLHRMAGLHPGIRHCLNEAYLRSRSRQREARFEIRVGKSGIADEVIVPTSTFDSEGIACAVRIFRRHQWAGFEGRRIVLPMSIADEYY